MFKYYNHTIIKSYRSYTVEQICSLFKHKKLHPQTVRGWVKSEKLETIANNPIVIYGSILKQFIKDRNDNHKVSLQFNQFKCLSCKEVITPKNNTIAIHKNKNGSLKAIANCSCCNSRISRFYKKHEQKNLESIFDVKQSAITTLKNSLDNASKTNTDNNQRKPQNEPNNQSNNSTSATGSKTNLTATQTSLLDLI